MALVTVSFLASLRMLRRRPLRAPVTQLASRKTPIFVPWHDGFGDGLGDVSLFIWRYRLFSAAEYGKASENWLACRCWWVRPVLDVGSWWLSSCDGIHLKAWPIDVVLSVWSALESVHFMSIHGPSRRAHWFEVINNWNMVFSWKKGPIIHSPQRIIYFNFFCAFAEVPKLESQRS